MKLLVFCHQGLAYMVPDKLFDKIEKADKEYHEGIDIEKNVEFIKSIEEKYKPIEVGYLLTGSLG